MCNLCLILYSKIALEITLESSSIDPNAIEFRRAKSMYQSLSFILKYICILYQDKTNDTRVSTNYLTENMSEVKEEQNGNEDFFQTLLHKLTGSLAISPSKVIM